MPSWTSFWSSSISGRAISTVSMDLLARTKKDAYRHAKSRLDASGSPTQGGDVTPTVDESVEVFSRRAHNLADLFAVRVPDRHAGELCGQIEADPAKERGEGGLHPAVVRVLDVVRLW